MPAFKYKEKQALLKNCPPQRFKNLQREAFRLVRSDPPTANDFLPCAICQPARVFTNSEIECSALYKSIYAYTFHSEVPIAKGQNFEIFPMRDGFSSVHFFSSIIQQVPDSDRPTLGALQYASPGTIVFKLNSDVSHRVREIYDAFREHQAESIKSYSFIRKWLRELGLSGENAVGIKLPQEVDKLLQKYGENFAAEIKLKDYSSILKKSPNSLMALKTLLAFYRRLQRFAAYEESGMVKLPSIPYQ